MHTTRKLWYKLNHQQNIFSFVSLAEILYHCFICVSLFFKKSSKSTLVMKDLYTTTNGGETDNLSGNCWGLRVIEVITLWRVICQVTGIISKHLYPTGIKVMYLALNAKAEVMQSTTLLLSYFWLKSCNDLARNTLKCMVSLTQILQIQINQEG